MNKSVSPKFAVLVILIAVVLGGLYVMSQYRAHRAEQAAVAAIAAQQRESFAARRAARLPRSGASGARAGQPPTGIVGGTPPGAGQD